MTEYKLLAKKSKCLFEVAKIEHLGHFVSADGFSADPQKITTVKNFLKAGQAFIELKGALTSAPVLALPDFNKVFVVVETDGITKDLQSFLQGCDIFRRSKIALAKYLGLLRPLPIHKAVWAEISLEFVEGLSKSKGFDVILVVVERLSKYAHFGCSSTTN
nr:uncharacterized protein LOC104093472 [Nicotiana tomentosiformis]